MGELVAALRANDPGAFECWLSRSVQDLGELQSKKIVRRNAGNILMADMKFFWQDAFLISELAVSNTLNIALHSLGVWLQLHG